MNAICLFAVALTLASVSQAFGKSDCSASLVNYRKAPINYRNVILRQWACVAATQVPFDQRDSEPKVKECMKKVILFKEIGAIKNSGYCIRLDDAAENSQDFLYVDIVDGVHTPIYQSTQAPTHGARL